jgi:hypothetical protein
MLTNSGVSTAFARAYFDHALAYGKLRPSASRHPESTRTSTRQPRHHDSRQRYGRFRLRFGLTRSHSSPYRSIARLMGPMCRFSFSGCIVRTRHATPPSHDQAKVQRIVADSSFGAIHGPEAWRGGRPPHNGGGFRNAEEAI